MRVRDSLGALNIFYLFIFIYVYSYLFIFIYVHSYLFIFIYIYSYSFIFIFIYFHLFFHLYIFCCLIFYLIFFVLRMSRRMSNFYRDEPLPAVVTHQRRISILEPRRLRRPTEPSRDTHCLDLSRPKFSASLDRRRRGCETRFLSTINKLSRSRRLQSIRATIGRTPSRYRDSQSERHSSACSQLSHGTRKKI